MSEHARVSFSLCSLPSLSGLSLPLVVQDSWEGLDESLAPTYRGQEEAPAGWEVMLQELGKSLLHPPLPPMVIPFPGASSDGVPEVPSLGLQQAGPTA